MKHHETLIIRFDDIGAACGDIGVRCGDVSAWRGDIGDRAELLIMSSNSAELLSNNTDV